jgi:hypothetical protein
LATEFHRQFISTQTLTITQFIDALKYAFDGSSVIILMGDYSHLHVRIKAISAVF